VQSTPRFAGVNDTFLSAVHSSTRKSAFSTNLSLRRYQRYLFIANAHNLQNKKNYLSINKKFVPFIKKVLLTPTNKYAKRTKG